MPFTLLPAIDLTDGRLGAFTPEGPRTIDLHGGDPLVAADRFVAAGARWLHVVDLDLAFGDAPANVAVVRDLAARHPDVAIQASGGIRTEEDARAFLDAGARRVVLGSATLVDDDHVATLLDGLRDRAIVGIEVEDGAIRPRGADRVDLDLMATLGWLRAIGAPGFLVTAVTRVATLEGPDPVLVRRVARTGVPVLAAGGVRSLEDLAALREAGAVGAVVGRAALEGDLDLAEAVAWSAA